VLDKTYSKPFCNLQNRERTHAILVIGLHELLGNPITELIEPRHTRDLSRVHWLYKVEAVLDKTYSKYKSDLSFAIFKAIHTSYALYDIVTQY
jgi:hypothetical protein